MSGFEVHGGYGSWPRELQEEAYHAKVFHPWQKFVTAGHLSQRRYAAMVALAPRHGASSFLVAPGSARRHGNGACGAVGPQSGRHGSAIPLPQPMISNALARYAICMRCVLLRGIGMRMPRLPEEKMGRWQNEIGDGRYMPSRQARQLPAQDG